MKYIKQFEELKEEDEPIELIGYPEGNIVTVSPEEFGMLNDDKTLEIQWDDDFDEEGSLGQWRFFNEDELRIKKILNAYRKLKMPGLYRNAKKYNL